MLARAVRRRAVGAFAPPAADGEANPASLTRPPSAAACARAPWCRTRRPHPRRSRAPAAAPLRSLSPTHPAARRSAATLELQREKAKELTKFFKQQQALATINETPCVASRPVARLRHSPAARRPLPTNPWPPPATPPKLTARTALPRRRGFGWTKGNEIGNGRWVMFGLFVGMLTEYATSVDFVQQIKLTLSVLSIADLDE